MPPYNSAVRIAYLSAVTTTVDTAHVDTDSVAICAAIVAAYRAANVGTY
jgi:hypothetical protein